MNELSPKARAALRHLKSSQALEPDRRDDLWRRLQQSVAAGAAAAGGPTDDLITEPDRTRRVPSWIWAVAAAAAAVVVLWGAREISGEMNETGTERHPAVAPYEAERTSEGGQTRAANPRSSAGKGARPRPEPGPRIEPEPQPEPTADPVPEVPPPASESTAPPSGRSRPRHTSRPEPPTTLAREMSLMRRAQAALDARDPGGALRVLAEHHREFEDGQLAEDRRALRIVALCEQGSLAQARGEAASFRRDFPRSHYQRKIASCLNRHSISDSTDGSG